MAVGVPDTNIVTAIVGAPSTGKTWTAKKSLKAAYLARPDLQFLVVGRFNNKDWAFLENEEESQETPIPIIKNSELVAWNSGEIYQEHRIMRTAEKPVQDALKILANYCSNLTFLLEEAGVYFTEGKLPGYMDELLQDAKQKNIDMIGVFHYIAEIPKKYAKKTRYLLVKKTDEEYDSSIKNKFSNLKLKRAMEIVNASDNDYIEINLKVGHG